MTTKELYFRQAFRRENVIGDTLLRFFAGFASYPRLLLEVFIRKNLGDRYFSVSSVITTTILLGLYPIGLMRKSNNYGGDGGGTGFWGTYGTWYIFLIAFLYFSFLRWKEVRRIPGVFDFEHFSLSTGEIHPIFYRLPFGLKPTRRFIEVFLEPALFFTLGIVLWMFAQGLGRLLVISSIFYALSYLQSYKVGDDFVKDMIDKMILNRHLEEAIVLDDSAPQETNGFTYRGPKPATEKMRRKLSKLFSKPVPEEETMAL